jgi:hypothetical protein
VVFALRRVEVIVKQAAAVQRRRAVDKAAVPAAKVAVAADHSQAAVPAAEAGIPANTDQ